MIHIDTVTSSDQQLRSVGAAFGKRYTPDIRLIALVGPLGAGKTTFVQGIASGLGITANVVSPTFTLIQEYAIPKTKRRLIHVDLYRIEKKEEFGPLHFADYLHDPEAIMCIEWADRFPHLWKKTPHALVTIAPGKESARHVIIRAD